MHHVASLLSVEPLRELSCTRLDAFDQSAASEVIRLEATASHKAEELPGLLHLVAANEDIYEGIEGDVCWSQTYFLHMIKELFSFCHHTLLRTAFDQCIK